MYLRIDEPFRQKGGWRKLSFSNVFIGLSSGQSGGVSLTGARWEIQSRKVIDSGLKHAGMTNLDHLRW